jgi:hypothetical protein
VILALLLVGTRAEGAGLEHAPGGLGLGLVAGNPSGISWALRSGGDSYFQGAVGWSLSDDRLETSLDYCRTLETLDVPEAPNLTFPIYVGLGGHLQIGDGEYREDEAGLGLRVPVGLAMVPRSFSADVFLELAPSMRLFPETDFTLDAGLGARIYFF